MHVADPGCIPCILYVTLSPPGIIPEFRGRIKPRTPWAVVPKLKQILKSVGKGNYILGVIYSVAEDMMWMIYVELRYSDLWSRVWPVK